MIKFFRKIRRQLLKDNRISKYLLYAIGEIVLVVIGILIALAINDRYNASQNEQKIKAILHQVQEDILVDIKDSKRIFGHFVRKDSTAQKIYKNLASVKTKTWKLRPNQGFVNFSINRGGYERLVSNLENLPEKYNVLMPILNKIYVVNQDDVNDANKSLIAAANDKQFNRAYTDPEHAKHVLNDFSTEESKQYLLDDPFLKNKTIEYMAAFKSVAMTANTFRIYATSLYKQIDTLLGEEKALNSELLRLNPDQEIIEPYLGEYKHFKGSEVFPGLTLKFENGQFYYSDNKRQRPLFWHQANFYFNSRSLIFKFFKGNIEEQFLEISNGVNNQLLVKV